MYLKNIVTTTLLILASLYSVLTQGAAPAPVPKKIGDYTIPVDTLNDNFCTTVGVTKFSQTQQVDTLYSSFVDEKLRTLKEPVRNYLNKKDYVSANNFKPINIFTLKLIFLRAFSPSRNL